MNERIAKAKAISKVFDDQILEKLGFEFIENFGSQCSCPIHGGDNPTAFSYDFSKKIWSCFTHQCHKTYGNDMIGLIRSMNECTFDQAIDWIYDNIQVNENVDIEGIYKSSISEDYESLVNTKNSSIDESKLQNLSKDFSVFNQKKFESKTFEFFEAGVCKSNMVIHQRLMIPVRCEEGNLIGFNGRSLFDKNKYTNGYHPESFKPRNGTGQFFSKWRVYPKKLNKSIELYNLNNAKEYVKSSNTCYLVEGPFDVWRFWEAGFKNCVASLGTNLSIAQYKKLYNNGCIKLKICYDSDLPGIESAKKICQKYGDKFDIQVVKLPESKDPADLSVKELVELLQ